MVSFPAVKVLGSLLLVSALVACNSAPVPQKNIQTASVSDSMTLNKKASSQSGKVETQVEPQEVQKNTEVSQIAHFSGFYANTEYTHRKHGADWTGFRITPLKNGQYKVHIEGRVVHEKSTCSGTFTNAHEVNAHMLSIPTQVGELYLTFKDKTLYVNAKKLSTLYYFCSGGASLRGTYTLIK